MLWSVGNGSCVASAARCLSPSRCLASTPAHHTPLPLTTLFTLLRSISKAMLMLVDNGMDSPVIMMENEVGTHALRVLWRAARALLLCWPALFIHVCWRRQRKVRPMPAQYRCVAPPTATPPHADFYCSGSASKPRLGCAGGQSQPGQQPAVPHTCVGGAGFRAWMDAPGAARAAAAWEPSASSVVS